MLQNQAQGAERGGSRRPGLGCAVRTDETGGVDAGRSCRAGLSDLPPGLWLPC